MSLFGFADLHCHPMSHLGFGGATIAPSGRRFFFGLLDNGVSATPDPGYALPCCRPAHMVNLLLPLLVDQAHGQGRGYPEFDWPTHRTILHQQMYFEWMKRAWQGGLRLMCALAVHNKLMAWMYDYPTGTDLGDTAAVRAQLTAMKRFAGRHHAWMQIVTSSDEARACIAAGRLAVVLGTEVDSLGELRSEGDATPGAVDALLSQLHADGVRAITPIHLANNAFGGCAIYDDLFNLSNHFLGQDSKHRFFRVRGGALNNGVEYRLGLASGSTVIRNAYLNYVRRRPRPGAVELEFPDYGAANPSASCNEVGLTGAGQRFLKGMMKRGMLIDTDHMSELARDAALTLAEAHAFPVYSSHSTLRELALSRAESAPSSLWGCAHEGMLTLRQLERIRELGGLVAPMTNMGPTRSHRGLPATPQAYREDDTSLSWMNGYAYAVEKMAGKGGVALGTDFNGFARQPGPRFVKGRAPAGPVTGVTYDADRPVYTLGSKRFDFNEMGLAHYGLLPDFLSDAEVVLQRPALETLYRSAEAYCDMWKRCEERAQALGGIA